MDPQTVKWSYPGAGRPRAPGARVGTLASWLQPFRSRTRPDVEVSTSSISPSYRCRNMSTHSAIISNTAPYSVIEGASAALENLLKKCQDELPLEARNRTGDIKFKSSFNKGHAVLFPCPLKQQDAVGAIKGLEALMASTLAKLRPGLTPGATSVDMMRVACFISSAYITTVNGYTKARKEVKEYLPRTDLKEAQSILYRRLSAGMYETKDEERYYHIHGSLDASTTLNMIGLPSHNEELVHYDKCIEVIGGAVRKFTVAQLEHMNAEKKQAGVEVLKRDEFLEKPHGKAMAALPPFTVRVSEYDETTRPAPFEKESFNLESRQVLQGIRVLELCRIIAGPTIGRSLAALGADVLKVTSDRLPDVPFFQVDGNTGKYCISLNLDEPDDCKEFEKLLVDADVVIDGYRPGSLDRRGYGPKGLAKLAKQRGKGYVYVAEDCFGGTGVGGAEAEWAHRGGWQQIADCVTGVAWEQGLFMEKKEPVIPPFPMSDYGTGALGSLAALVGLYNRATKGGSWVCRTSLVQYDLFLLSLGNHTKEVQAKLRHDHKTKGGVAFFQLKHYDSVDKVGQIALESINKVHDNPFNDELMQEAWGPAFGGSIVKWPREAVKIEGLDIGHVRVSRSNGFDKVKGWECWNRDDDLLQGKNKSKPSKGLNGILESELE